MVWLIRYAFLALALVCVVSLLSLVAPDAKASDRRRYLYVGSVVVVCAVVCILFQTLVPTEFKVVGEGNEVVETHSLAALKTGSRLSGKASFSFGYLTEDEDYVLMVERGDGGYLRMRVPARRGSIWSSAFRLFAALISFLLSAGGCAICTSSLGRKCRYMFPREASNRAGTIFHSLSET